MSETTIDRLEADLRDAIADADERANVEGSERYWITVRDAYRTVLTMMIPTAKAERKNNF